MDWVKFNSHSSDSRFFLVIKTILFALRQWPWKRFFSPPFQLVRLALNSDIQEYVVTLKGCKHIVVEDVSASLISKNTKLIKKLSPEDANRIGYMAGVNDAVKDGYLK
jgi:hypothetical protein